MSRKVREFLQITKRLMVVNLVIIIWLNVFVVVTSAMLEIIGVMISMLVPVLVLVKTVIKMVVKVMVVIKVLPLVIVIVVMLVLMKIIEIVVKVPSNVVIKVAQDSVSKVKKSTTTKVEAMRREQAQEKSDVKLDSSVPEDPFDQCSFTTKEGLNVWWKYGNIAQEKADILVNSANANLNHPTMVGRVLNSVGGPSFVTWCSQHTNIGTGDIVTTISGSLPCSYVIHAVCCDWKVRSSSEQILRDLLRKLLVECDRLSASSVAMPLVGTGKHGFPEDIVLRAMRVEFKKFSSAHPFSTLKEIKVVRYGQGIGPKAVQVKVNASESSLPSNWSPQRNDQVVLLIELQPKSPEYLEVANHFVARGGRADQLSTVERIQNPRLYSAFVAVKKNMRGQGNELRLFHGTNATNTDSINAHNFSRSFAGVNGTAYGNGVYFARDASLSMGYAKCSHSGTGRKIYVAKVLVGEYTQGASEMKAPPPKNDPNNPGVRYDSVVDNPNNPSMYIIFQDNQCYPEYLLTLW